MTQSLRSGFGVALVLLLVVSAASAQGDATTTPAPPAAKEDSCTGQRFSTVFRCLGHDLGRVVTDQRLAWLGAGTAVGSASVLLDDEISQSMRDPDQDVAVRIGSNLGEATLHFGIPLTIYLAGRASGHADTAALGVVMLRTQIVNGVVTRALKLLPRTRPHQEVASPGVAEGGSFPSGHTSAAFATAAVLHRRWGWKAGVPAYLVASYIGVTRLENSHYLSDVTFGAALGIASGLAVDLPSKARRVTPMIGPGTAGVVVSIR
jgi:membrane-associated phospholipid phosphatase